MAASLRRPQCRQPGRPGGSSTGRRCEAVPAVGACLSVPGHRQQRTSSSWRGRASGTSSSHGSPVGSLGSSSPAPHHAPQPPMAPVIRVPWDGHLHRLDEVVDRARPGSKHHVLTGRLRHPIARVPDRRSPQRHHPAPAPGRGLPPVRGKRGRPRRKPRTLYADRGNDHDIYRRRLRERGITPKIARRGEPHGSGLG